MGRCDYCGRDYVVVRPTPYMADREKAMCESCWTMSRLRGVTVEGIDIGEFPGKAALGVTEE